MTELNNYPRGIEVTVGPLPINDNGEVMLCKSSKWPDWGVSGGHVEPGETLEQAVVREAKEELGVEVEVLEQLCMEECFMSPPEFKRNSHFIYFTFLVKIKPSQVVKIDNDEIIEYKWAPLKEALSLMGRTYKKPIEILLNRKS
ncbi:MAG: NUDIX domain-containing protein [Proteobacteria bacterium]|nr:NUDIX domain-containing protein [Pseudomonadota bacterium]